MVDHGRRDSRKPIRRVEDQLCRPGDIDPHFDPAALSIGGRGFSVDPALESVAANRGAGKLDGLPGFELAQRCIRQLDPQAPRFIGKEKREYFRGVVGLVPAGDAEEGRQGQRDRAHVNGSLRGGDVGPVIWGQIAFSRGGPDGRYGQQDAPEDDANVEHGSTVGTHFSAASTERLYGPERCFALRGLAGRRHL